MRWSLSSGSGLIPGMRREYGMSSLVAPNGTSWRPGGRHQFSSIGTSSVRRFSSVGSAATGAAFASSSGRERMMVAAGSRTLANAFAPSPLTVFEAGGASGTSES